MASLEIKSMNTPDETRSLPKTKGEVVTVGSQVIMRGTFDPGWRWSECVKPSVGTPSCQANHIMYIISGRMGVKMDDGTEKELKAGDAAVIPPGHDAWVIGSEPCVSVDFTAGATYGKK